MGGSVAQLMQKHWRPIMKFCRKKIEDNTPEALDFLIRAATNPEGEERFRIRAARDLCVEKMEEVFGSSSEEAEVSMKEEELVDSSGEIVNAEGKKGCWEDLEEKETEVSGDGDGGFLENGNVLRNVAAGKEVGDVAREEVAQAGKFMRIGRVMKWVCSVFAFSTATFVGYRLFRMFKKRQEARRAESVIQEKRRAIMLIQTANDQGKVGLALVLVLER